mmetsp:Transcript_1498/g.3219  ORF Transcript_1498/g.3219 Transcript_1498/m.3219 type:complete len:281 (+) Transcript_1498:225-1067(+)
MVHGVGARGQSLCQRRPQARRCAPRYTIGSNSSRPGSSAISRALCVRPYPSRAVRRAPPAGSPLLRLGHLLLEPRKRRVSLECWVLALPRARRHRCHHMQEHPLPGPGRPVPQLHLACPGYWRCFHHCTQTSGQLSCLPVCPPGHASVAEVWASHLDLEWPPPLGAHAHRRLREHPSLPQEKMCAYPSPAPFPYVFSPESVRIQQPHAPRLPPSPTQPILACHILQTLHWPAPQCLAFHALQPPWRTPRLRAWHALPPPPWCAPPLYAWHAFPPPTWCAH